MRLQANETDSATILIPLAMATSAQQQITPEAAVAARPNPVLTGAVLAASDLAAVVLAAVLAFNVWVHINPVVSQIFIDLWPALGLFGLVFALEGLYPGVGMTPVEELQKLFSSTSVVYLLLTASIFLTKNVGFGSRGVFISGWLLSVILLPLFRGVVYQVCSPKAWWGAPVIVIGAGKTAELVIREIRSKKALGFKPVVCLDDDPLKHGYCEDVPVVGTLKSAAHLAKLFGIRYAIVAMPGIHRERLAQLMEEYSEVFPHVILIPDLLGIASLWVSPRDLGGVLGLELRHNLLIPINRRMKRLSDVVFATLMGLAALPVIAAAAFWIKCVSPGPAFFWQEREGEGGRLIHIPKLRTMYLDAESLLAAYLESNPMAKAHWDRHCKLKDDPRILPGVGKLLRRLSLDELPQIWSILKGEMSLVGPRPFPVYHNERFDPLFRALRIKVTPGLTGLWQISERSDGDLDVQTKLDTYYIRNWSPWLDMYIISRTVRAVLMAKGAY